MGVMVVRSDAVPGNEEGGLGKIIFGCDLAELLVI